MIAVLCDIVRGKETAQCWVPESGAKVGAHLAVAGADIEGQEIILWTVTKVHDKRLTLADNDNLPG